MQKEIYNCPVCNQVSRAIYRMIFLVKDESTIGMDKIYKLHFYSYQAQAEDFFGGLKPVNLYRDSVALTRIKDYIRLMSKFNIYIDIIIRRKYSQRQNDDLFELFDGKLIDLPKLLNDKKIGAVEISPVKNGLLEYNQMQGYNKSYN